MNKDQEEQLLMKLIIQAVEKLDKITETLDSRLDNIDITMAKNTASLEEHMARTELLEESLKPVRSAYDWMIISFKVLGALALLISVIGGVYEGIKFLLRI